MTPAADSPFDATVLGRAIARVEDQALRRVLTREVALLRDSRSFGLVFDRHLPESARLPSHPIGPGMTVVRRDDSGDAVRQVVEIDGEIARLDDGTEEVLSRLVVFRDFGDAVHPGLRSVERLDRGAPDAPWHTVINGENLHALQVLRETHAGAVDLIYIDPPYNTGNEGWIYNDKYVDPNDRAKSSKWLSFMERRLKIAQSLLKPTGVIIVAIGDQEHHRLRMLMDQVFEARNFISDVVWQGGRKNDSRYVSNGADYMLVYAGNEAALAAEDTRWREEKDGVHAVLAAGAAVWREHGPNEDAATAAMRAWFRAQPKESPVHLLSRNVWFLPDGTLCRDADTRSPNPRPNLQYDLIHPVTGKPCRRHPNGWVYSQETMQRLIEEGRIIFRASEEDVVSLKRPLVDTAGNVAMSVFEKNRVHAGRHLESLLGDKRFPFPKDHEVLMRWIRLAAPKDAVTLDFFGGSGTTTEAVLRLNAQDGGTRQSILVTNNEVGAKTAKALRKAGHHPGDPEWESVGVFEHVTRPRISTVVTGQRPDGTSYSDGIEANVELFDLTYLDPSELRRGREFESIAPILWVEAGAIGTRIDGEPETGWALVENYGVLFDVDALKPFAEAVTDRAKNDDLPSLIYVVTDSPAEARLVGERLPSGCTVHRLYEPFVQRFALSVDGEAT